MPDPITVDQLAARVAVIEQRLGIIPPGPLSAVPVKPGPIQPTKLADGRWQLDWPNPGDATSWEVVDLLNLTEPIKETVTVPRSIRSAIKAGTQRAYAIRARNAAGASELSDVLNLPPVAPTPSPTPRVSYPVDLVGKNWYLTTPIPRPVDGLALEVRQPALATYESKYFLLNDNHDAALFRVWHGGATTKGSANPRTELREEINDGAGHAAWSTTAGRHRMVVRGRVNRLTKVRPHLVIAQIHDAADDVTVFRVEGNNLWITAGDTPHGYLLDSNFQVGRDYEIGFDVSGGVVSYLYSGRVVPYTLKASTTGCYYKAGAYLQSSPTSAPGESPEEYAEAMIYSVTVTHS